MVGFIAEFLIFRGSFAVFPVQTLLCMLGTALTAVYFLILLDRAFFGRLEIVGHRAIAAAVQWQEKVPALSLAALVLAFGLQPHWLSRWLEGSVSLMLGG
jgi:NAD(P)H-quinone oxidoreductase subunit 4